MFNVRIEYKSGKIEKAKIKIGEYSEALRQLVGEKRITGIFIESVE